MKNGDVVSFFLNGREESGVIINHFTVFHHDKFKLINFVEQYLIRLVNGNEILIEEKNIFHKYH